MTRGTLRTDIDENTCADRLEQLYASECELRRAKGNVGLYSLTSGENGGGNPSAPGPWSIIAKGRKRSDCIGTATWARGFDRYQPQRFAHIYGGYVNTDAMSLDAFGEYAVTGRGESVAPRKMFRPATSLRRGVFVVYPGLYLRGRKVPGSWGHILTVVEFDPSIVETPANLVDVASKITVVHCHGGVSGRTVQSIGRETLAKAIGASAKRARLIELIKPIS